MRVLSSLFHVLLNQNHIFCACFLQESEQNTAIFSSEQGNTFVTPHPLLSMLAQFAVVYD